MKWKDGLNNIIKGYLINLTIYFIFLVYIQLHYLFNKI